MPLVVHSPNAPQETCRGAPRPIEIALLNNLGDKALAGGERQFTDILSIAAGPLPVRLRLFSLPGIARGPESAARIAQHYTPFADLMQSRVDGLIVTGCEPQAARLPLEPVWSALTEVVDWAEHHTASTIFSCFAAHAAVLHLDGVDRRPLARKCSGLFAVEQIGSHPLLAGLKEPLMVPHSRWNGLDEAELEATGYRILTRSPEAGVDLFIKQWNSLFVYLQGHPEYEENALRREYRRDVRRFLDGEVDAYPDLPRHYFSDEMAASLETFATAARRDRATEMPFPLRTRGGAQRPRWRRTLGIGLLRNWFAHLSSAREARVA